jgi:hypothetical protein
MVNRRTITLIVAVIAAGVIVTVLISLFVLKPWQSPQYKECVATLEQLNGGEDVPDSIVDTECGPHE